MHAAARQIPQQPSINRPKQQIAISCFFPRARYVIQNPLDLSRGEVRVDYQTGFFVNQIFIAILDQLFGNVAGLLGLPNDRMVDWLTGVAIPDDRRFPLVGNPNRGNAVRLDL